MMAYKALHNLAPLPSLATVLWGRDSRKDLKKNVRTNRALKEAAGEDLNSSRGVQPCGVSGPHWKKSCLGPHIKYTNTNEN